ncbi:hypothetical protein [Parasitella parasitica]|uniref:Chitin synthase 4-like domain-containing protein n=1 Tax=Parasitella parasitica TaxID=35722 RepID=A0A0B7NFM4_9FUNG|nr:hypothetical protein [Parasitella parasitica]
MSNPNNRSSGYRPDPRLSQSPYAMRPPTASPQMQHQQQQSRGPRVQSYSMDPLNRPRPPPHHQQQQQQQRRPPSHHYHHQQQQQQPPRQSVNYMYQSSRQQPSPQRMSTQGGRPMRPQHQPMVPPGPMGGQGPYRRVSVNRSRSLSRPERKRPRQGMIRSPSQQQRLQQQQQYYNAQYGYPQQRPRPPNNYPMPNRLQSQLQQQKMQQQQQQQQQQEALLNPSQQPAAPHKKQPPPPPPEEKVKVLTSWWAWLAFLMTCCIPNWFLRVCLRKRNAMVQQAWREKLSLCYIIFILCAALAFITYGLNKTLCPTPDSNSPFSRVTNGVRVPVYYSDVRVFGTIYPMNVMKSFFETKGMNLTNDYENTDISSIFDGDTTGACAKFPAMATTSCALVNPYGGGMAAPDNTCLSLAELHRYYKSSAVIGFDWQDLNKDLVYGRSLTLVGDSVLNLTKYMNFPAPPFGQDVDHAIRNNLANDLSYALLYSQAGKDARKCLAARYKVGIMETETGGCIADSMIMTLMLVVIIVMIVIRYSMALLFQWFISRRLTKPGGRSNWLAWRSIKGGNDDPANHIPGPYNNYGVAQNASSTSLGSGSSRNTPLSEQSSAVVLGSGTQSDIVTTELYTVMLIFFVIADGMITGHGESKSTPDIVVSMMDLDPTMSNPKPASYLAIADGEKQLNMAKVYAGHYKGVPCITIVKCGTEEEANLPKAGNRGKRDSQLILMSYFQRVLFNDRLSELDYEIFWKMTWLMKGVTPDKFELVLMV